MSRSVETRRRWTYICLRLVSDSHDMSGQLRLKWGGGETTDDNNLRSRFKPSFGTSDRRAAIRSQTSRTAGCVETLPSMKAFSAASSCDLSVEALALATTAENSPSGMASWPSLSDSDDLDTIAGTMVSRMALKTAHSVSLQKSSGDSAGRAGLSGAIMSPVRTMVKGSPVGTSLALVLNVFVRVRMD